jgi:hypothetical protein
MLAAVANDDRHHEVSSLRYELGLCKRRMFKLAKNQKYPCPVCGFHLDYPADDFNICPSCGVEFGYETAGRTFAELRDEWINAGARWASSVIPQPKGWNQWMQLLNAGYRYNFPFHYRVEVETVPRVPPQIVGHGSGFMAVST